MTRAADTWKRGGFTLVEVITTMSLVGILASIALLHLQGSTATARAAALASDMRLAQQAIFEYFVDHGAWPPAAPAGEVPEGLAPFLPDGFRFGRHGAQLAYQRPVDGGTGIWSDGGSLEARVEADQKMRDALRRILEADRVDGSDRAESGDGWVRLLAAGDTTERSDPTPSRVKTAR